MTLMLRDCANLYPLIFEAALRALLAAAVVWAGLRLLRIANVVVMKAAWALVLVASIALPLMPGLRSMPTWAALRLPAVPASLALRQAAAIPVAVTTPAQIATESPGTSMADAATESYSSPAISDEHYGSTAQTTAIENQTVDEAVVGSASERQSSIVAPASTAPAASA